MNCIKQMISCFYYSVEACGIYEPEIDFQEASDRLRIESQLWAECQKNRDAMWGLFQKNNPIDGPLSSLTEKAIAQVNFEKGIAVDLGCGNGTTLMHLLERGWKVYAVDSSNLVLENLTLKVSKLGKDWIETGQLVLIHQTIEDFQFPEKVHLVTATESLTYCDPNKIHHTFQNIKNALYPQGRFACSLFPYKNRLVDSILRDTFGAWLTTKNVMETLMRSTDFDTWSVTDGKSPCGMAKQIHILAKA